MTTVWNWPGVGLRMGCVGKFPKQGSWPFRVDRQWQGPWVAWWEWSTKLCMYPSSWLREIALYQANVFFPPSFFADIKKYNKIKQSKLAYEGLGLNRRNFQKEGGQALKCITSGILCHIIFWSVSQQGWISICLRYVSNRMPRWY